MLWLILRHRLNATQRLSHFAPEPGLARRCAAAVGRYVSVDLNSMYEPQLRTDITAISFREASFDGIICSHVLEHVPADYAAMRECARVLKPGGRFAVQVPMCDGPTDEDATITDPAIRLQRFRQEDHVRLYGMDITDRLRAAGFAVDVLTVLELPVAVRQTASIPDTEHPLFWCHLH